MSLVTQQIFYYRYGIRKTSQLITPPLPFLDKLTLPQESIYHYPGVGPLDDGPTPDASVFNLNNRPIYLQNVTELGDSKGNPRRLTMDVDRLGRKFRATHPRFKAARDLPSATRDINTLLVYNYAYIHRLYRYLRNYYTSYYKWANLNASVWNNIAALTEQSSRNHFIELALPKILPSISSLRMAERVINQKTMQVFDSSESWSLLEVWKWLGANRQASLISAIKPENYKKVNLILRESNRWTVVNLGQLDAWRLSEKLELETLKDPILKGYSADQMQKRFLRLTVALFEARTNAALDENLEVVDDVLSAAQQALKNKDNTVTAGNGQTVTVKTNSRDEPVLNNHITKVDKGEEDQPEVITPGAITIDEIISDDDTDEVPVDTTDISHTTFDAVGVDDELDSDDQIDADLERLEEMGSNAMVDEEAVGAANAQNGVVIEIKDVRTLESAIVEHANRLADSGGLSAAEYRKYIEMAGTYKTIIAENGQTLDRVIDVKKTDVEMKASPSLPDKNTIIDKTMNQSSLLEFDKKYVKEVLHRDVAAMVMHVQNAGVIVTDYRTETVEDITGSHIVHEVKIKPLQGTGSTLYFKLPKVDDEGNFKVNGVNYRMRKQRGDLPIRKISPRDVALTTYYGKLFVERSQKRANNYGRWLTNAIMELAFHPEIDTVGNLAPGNCFNPAVKLPRLYTTLAQSFTRFQLKIVEEGVASYWDLSLDYKNRIVPKSIEFANLERDGNVMVGTNPKTGAFLFIGADNNLYRTNGSSLSALVALPPLEDILGIGGSKTPLDFAELRVFGKTIPVGVVLSYLLGMDKVLKALNVTPRIVPAGMRTQMTSDEWSLVFQDETWVFSRDNELACMVLGGWRDFKQTTSLYNAHEFNKRDVYLNVLEDAQLGVRYLRELDLLDQMFVDPIAKELLLEMGEPTDFRGLLYRSSELLLTEDHPQEMDGAYMRIKGYERFSGAVYAQLVRSIRSHNGRPGKSRYPVELNPYAVWIDIQQDPAKNQVIEQNPIQNLKEIEAVTYSGTGGRSSRSMTKRTRIYHPSDMGTISESTVDNSDVGINTFLSADPQFTSLRGTSKRYKVGETGATPLLSTSALVSVAADKDDPKRVNFIAIQHSHGVACNGYTQNQVRTGYEQIIAQRTGDMFAVTAKQPGKVISVTAEGIIVEYQDGTRQGVKLGTIYGNAAGLVIPHSITTTMRIGQVFQPGSTIAYNTGFFEPDVLNPNQVVWKSSTNARTVLLESPDTLEDSSAISESLAERLQTKITKVRTVVVNFDQRIHKLVKPGDAVETESILCIIEDALGSGISSLDEETLDTLRVLSAQSPQAKVQGVIERVELYYHGDKEDMSESLQALSNASDAQIARRNKAIGAKAFTGSVDENFRIDNEALALDTVAIQIYITSTVKTGVGDKGVFGNQMKTVFGRVFGDGVKTESGLPIDAIFGAKSIDDRIVTSPIVIGTSTTLLRVLAKKMVELYKS